MGNKTKEGDAVLHVPANYWCSGLEYTIKKNGTGRCQVISSKHTEHKSSSHLAPSSTSSPSISLSPPSLCVWPDVRGNILEGRESAYNGTYKTSPNLILQQMAKCNLWPWQIAVLVKPSSALWKKGGEVRGADRWGYREWKHIGRMYNKKRTKYLRARGCHAGTSCTQGIGCRNDLVGSFEGTGVKLDRFERDQQLEHLRVKLEWVKTHERDVKKHEKAN